MKKPPNPADDAPVPIRRDKAIASLSGAGPESARSEPAATELAAFFLAEVELGVAELNAALRAGDRDTAKAAADRVSQATARIGSSRAAEHASALERSLLQDEASISAIAEKMESLLLLCREAAEGE